jgi:hypothetical protein
MLAIKYVMEGPGLQASLISEAKKNITAACLSACLDSEKAHDSEGARIFYSESYARGFARRAVCCYLLRNLHSLGNPPIMRPGCGARFSSETPLLSLHTFPSLNRFSHIWMGTRIHSLSLSSKFLPWKPKSYPIGVQRAMVRTLELRPQ